MLIRAISAYCKPKQSFCSKKIKANDDYIKGTKEGRLYTTKPLKVFVEELIEKHGKTLIKLGWLKK